VFVTERMRYVVVDVIDPRGRPAAPMEAALIRGEARWPLATGVTAAVPEGPAEVALVAMPGRFPIEVRGETLEVPTRLSLQAAELLVWLGDPGGRDFGGLPVVARCPAGEARGRVGEPFLLWAGTWAVTVGSRGAGVAPWTVRVEVRPERTTLELGRLAALVVRWGEARGWPVRVRPATRAGEDLPVPASELESPIPAEDSGDAPASSISGTSGQSSGAPVQASRDRSPSSPALTARGSGTPPQMPGAETAGTSDISSLELEGRLGEPLSLWPDRYRIEVDGGPTGEIEVRAGRLAELELGISPASLSSTLRQAPGAVGQTLREAGDVLERLGAVSLARTLRRVAPPPVKAARGGDARAGLAGRGPSIRVMLRDARGYALTGWPMRLHPLSGSGPVIDARVGLPSPAVPGRYRIELARLPGLEPEVTIGADETRLELAPLGALELVLRDGMGASMRGAVYTVRGAGGAVTGALSQTLPLAPGQYAIEIPTTPVIRREVEIRFGEVNELDLGALGKLDITAGPEVPWGTPVWIRPDPVSADPEPVEQAEAAADVEAGDSSDAGEMGDAGRRRPAGGGDLRGFVGQTMHLPVMAYRVWVGRREGEGESIELRPGRIRRPTVVGRGFEPLAPDDANKS
jgi:hypothetical protein